MCVISLRWAQGLVESACLIQYEVNSIVEPDDNIKWLTYFAGCGGCIQFRVL